jgi:hypothetical protein
MSKIFGTGEDEIVEMTSFAKIKRIVRNNGVEI